MAVQFPTLSTQEQNDRVDKLSKGTLFPYTFATELDNNASDFPFTDVSGVLKYNTINFKADNLLGLYGIQIAYTTDYVFQQGSAAQPTYSYGFCVSYSPLFDSQPTANPNGAFPNPTIPGDRGNDIFRYSFTVTNPTTAAGGRANVYQTIYERFEPYNYLVKFNQYLYIHITADAASAASNNGHIFPSIILHTLPSGFKV